MTLPALLAIVVVLGVERACYVWIVRAPRRFERWCAGSAVGRRGAPIVMVRKLFYGFKLVQFSVFAGWCWFFAERSSALRDRDWSAVAIGAALIVIGQALNWSVFYRLRAVGVFFGDRFGYPVSRCAEFPFSLLAHPQYAGCVLSIWGLFVALRFPHDDWIVLPALETVYYVAGAWLEEHPPESRPVRSLARCRVSIVVVLALLASVAWAADVFVVEDWTKHKLGAKGIPDGWKGGQTWGTPKHDFTIVDHDGHRGLRLKSQGDISVITREIKGQVRLESTPVLEWSWKVTSLPKGGDARNKNTDDEAAQVYVTWPHFPRAVRSRIIGYIWDTQAPQGSFIKSGKTDTVTYVVVRSGTADLGKWLTERRNVVDDFRKIYGEDSDDPPGAVSIAIDSNDTSSSAEAFIGPIVFRKP